MNAFFNFSEITGTNSELMKLAKDIPNKDMDVKDLDKPIAKDLTGADVGAIDSDGAKKRSC